VIPSVEAAVKEATMAKLSLALMVIGGMLAAGSPLRACAGETTVLDLHAGSCRGFVRYRTPRIIDERGKVVPLLEPRRRGQKEQDRKPMPDVALSMPPDGWAGPDFDDSGWPRVRGVLASGISRPNHPVHQTWRATAANLLCARAAFRVNDPAAVKSLKLDLVYIGGCVVYVNGTEVARAHLPAGKLTADTLAEAYPRRAYVDPKGKFHKWGGDGQLNFHDPSRYRRELKNSTLGKVRFRSLAGVAVPGRLLHKGINVLAVEVRTAPVRGILIGSRSSKWPHAGLYEFRLRAAGTAGLEAIVGPRPKLAVQNVQLLEPTASWDYALPAAKLRPIRMVGARGGVFSGKVLVSSAAAIRGLKATSGALKLQGGGAVIPASAVQIRCAVRGEGRLREKFPAEIRPVSVWSTPVRGRAPPTACANVWLTVRVPTKARPGIYRGRLQVSAAGTPARQVPVELDVADWRVPAPKDWALQHHIYQSPESVARYYKVPLWSDRHFELIGKSFEVLNQVGNKVLPMNLIADNYTWGNREGMVRWVKNGKGGYTYDFSIVEKYMDVYKAKCGDPGTVYLSIWSHANWPTKEMPRKKVTVVDPTTGKVSSMDQPPLGTRENEEFWRPVMIELRKRLKKRGWYKRTAVAYTSYTHCPSKEMVDVYRRIWPDGKWFNCSHSGPRSYPGTQAGMPVARCEWVWGCGGLYNPDAKGGRGRRKAYPRPWKRLGGKWISLANPRIGTGLTFSFDAGKPPTAYRFISEACVQGDVNGLGRLGADFWPCLPDARGRMRTMDNDEFGLGFRSAVQAMLSPGKGGATFNEKLEMFREGVQIAEAIVQVQRGLESGRLGAELAGKIEDLLDERARYWLHTLDAEVCDLPWWSLECSGWQERDRKLFALAGRVAKTLGGK
jgi:hypothetical protein